MSYLTSKGLVSKVLTQNVDGLDLKAGIPEEKIIFCHGTLKKAHCAECKFPYDVNEVKKSAQNDTVLKCNQLQCTGIVKPKVVLYGEMLDTDFYEFYKDLQNIDLCVIVGTSLKVSPFNQIPLMLPQSCYKILVNNEKVGSFQFDNVSNNELFLQGASDKIFDTMINDLGFKDEFETYIKSI